MTALSSGENINKLDTARISHQLIVSANLSTDQVKPALSPHLMVVTRSDVFSTIITKMSTANSLVLIFYYFGHHLPSQCCACSQPGSEHFWVGNCHLVVMLFSLKSNQSKQSKTLECCRHL